MNSIDGLSAWMDASLEADDSWATQIQTQLDAAEYVVVLLSPDVNRQPPQRRSFVLNEIDYAQQEPHPKPILPVLVQPTKMPVQIAGVQFIDLTATPDDPTPIVDRICGRFGIESPSQRQHREARQAARAIPQQRSENPPAARRQTPPYNRYLIGTVTLILVGVLALAGIFALINRLAAPSVGIAATPSTDSTAYAAAVDRAQNFAGGNADWQPFYWTFDDGVEMALVPAGCFMMGSDAAQIAFAAEQFAAEESFLNSELPAHEQCFERPFWIDRTEVAQANFTRLDGAANTPSGYSGADRPRERVTWFEARAFCIQRGGRLPTEREWEYAARGVSGVYLPWGWTWTPENVVWNRESTAGTSTVGSIAGGASWVGALDMSGNVWEWTSSLFLPYEYDAADGRENPDDILSNRIVRGGSWNDSYANILRSANRGWFTPDTVTNFIGFRCVRDLALNNE